MSATPAIFSPGPIPYEHQGRHTLLTAGAHGPDVRVVRTSRTDQMDLPWQLDEPHVLLFLERHAFPAPRLLETTGDAMVLSCLEGVPLYAGVRPLGATIRRIGALLARLHRLPALAEDLAAEATVADGAVLLAEALTVQATVRQAHPGLLEELGFPDEPFALVAPALREGGRPIGLCHGECAPHHMLVQPEGLALLGWRHAILADGAYDLALARLRLRLNVTASAVLLDAYLAEYARSAGRSVSPACRNAWREALEHYSRMLSIRAAIEGAVVARSAIATPDAGRYAIVRHYLDMLMAARMALGGQGGPPPDAERLLTILRATGHSCFRQPAGA